MVRRKPEPRYVRPENLGIGDMIRASWLVDDVRISREGKIAKREYDGQFRVFLTNAGHELFRWHPSYPREIRVTLLDRAPVPQPTLFDSLADALGDSVG